MDSISDLLEVSKPDLPPQIKALKFYIRKHHGIEVQCSINKLGYTITVPDGMIATTLRMEMPAIIQECDLDKKLFIRIGHF